MPSDDLSRAVARMRSENIGKATMARMIWDTPLLADTLHRLAEIVGCEVGELETHVAALCSDRRTLHRIAIKTGANVETIMERIDGLMALVANVRSRETEDAKEST